MAIVRSRKAEIARQDDTPKRSLAAKAKSWLAHPRYMPPFLARIVQLYVPCTCAKTRRLFLMRFIGNPDGKMLYVNSRKYDPGKPTPPISPPVELSVNPVFMNMFCPHCMSIRLFRCPACRRYVCGGLGTTEQAAYTCVCGHTFSTVTKFRSVKGNVALKGGRSPLARGMEAKPSSGLPSGPHAPALPPERG